MLGPVNAVYGEDAPGWIARGDFHSTRPAPGVGGRILKGYAGNVLIRRRTIERLGLRFDLALGRQGAKARASRRVVRSVESPGVPLLDVDPGAHPPASAVAVQRDLIVVLPLVVVAHSPRLHARCGPTWK